MATSQPSEDAKFWAVVEILEPALVATLEEHGVPFTVESTRRVVRAVLAVAVRYFIHAGGSTETAKMQCARGIRTAEREVAEVEAFAAAPQAPAEA